MPPLILTDNRFIDGTPVASATAAGFDARHLADTRPFTFWRAPAAGTFTIKVDAGSAKAVDTLAICGHNLATIGATISVESSPDNAAWTSRLTYEELLADSSRNLITDPSVSLDGGTLAYWDVSGGATYSAAGGYNDNGPCLKTIGGQVGHSAALQDVKYLPGQLCSEGDRVVAAARCKLSADFASTSNASVGIMWTKADGSFVSENVNCDKLLLDQWQLLSMVGTAPAGTVSYRFRAIFFFAAGSTGHMLTDNIFLSKVNASERIQADGSVAWALLTNHAALRTFASATIRHWRLTITAPGGVPELAVCFLGSRLTFPAPPDAPYIPVEQDVEAETTISESGYPLGTAIRFKPLRTRPTFSNLPRTWVFDTFRPIWENYLSDRRLFFYAWDLATYPNDFIYLAQHVGKYSPGVSILTLADRLELDLRCWR